MSVAGPVVPRHPPAPVMMAAAAAGGDDDDGDDSALPSRRRRLKSAHEADLEPVRDPGRLVFACEPCRLAFPSEESAKAHHGGSRKDMFLTMHLDPRYDQILVQPFTLAQAAAIVRAARHRQGPHAY